MNESRLLTFETLTKRANRISKELLHLVQQFANCSVNSKTYYRLIDEIDYKKVELKDQLDKLLTEIKKGEL